MYVYILRSLKCSSQLYVGVTTDINLRLRKHNSGRSFYASKYIPWRVVYSELFEDRCSAFQRERQIKSWTRAKKEALIAGDEVLLKALARRGG